MNSGGSQSGLALSPREWGCTEEISIGVRVFLIVPTRVGVYRWDIPTGKLNENCPHASGGVPRGHYNVTKITELSPREWGCTECEVIGI